jgi:fatty-acid desaturase
MRLDKMFGHRLIMTPLASYTGFASMILGTYLLISGQADPLWIISTLFFTFMILMGVTVGLHRLFCHRAFKTSIFWNTVLAYLGTLAVYGSSVQWAAMHMSHHIYSDTDKDPHETGWRYLFWKKNRPTEFHRKTLIRMYRNHLHRFLHQYYLLVILSTILILYLINPLALLFCYLIPLGWLHFVGSAHQVFAHNNVGPKDQPILELFLFTGGEWLHKHHHTHGKDPNFGTFDLGYQFIKLIRK